MPVDNLWKIHDGSQTIVVALLDLSGTFNIIDYVVFLDWVWEVGMGCSVVVLLLTSYINA